MLAACYLATLPSQVRMKTISDRPTVSDGRIVAIDFIADPDKLRHLPAD